MGDERTCEVCEQGRQQGGVTVDFVCVPCWNVLRAKLAEGERDRDAHKRSEENFAAIVQTMAGHLNILRPALRTIAEAGCFSEKLPPPDRRLCPCAGCIAKRAIDEAGG